MVRITEEKIYSLISSRVPKKLAKRMKVVAKEIAEVLAETDTEIAKRVIGEYVTETLKDAEEGCPVAREFRAIFNGCINWLDQREEE